MRDRKILLVSHWYAPALHPRAFRWSAVASRWAALGHRVDVVCSWAPGLPLEETVEGVHVFRVGGELLGRLKDRLWRPPAFRAAAVRTTDAPEGTSSISRLAGWMSDAVWKKVRWPDYACLWYFPALREARRLAVGNAYTAAVTVSDPFTCHLVGLRLKKDSPAMPWLVDAGDPFSFQDVTPVNNTRMHGRRNESAEREVLSRADAVAVTNPAAMTEYAARFPESAGKIHVVPPLLSLPPPTGAPRFFPEDGKLRLVFIGTLYRDVRNPAFLLRLFERLLASPLSERIELHFFGDTNDCRDYFTTLRADIAGKIRLHGMVGRETVARAMAEAAALVHIGNATIYQLPSKVVEYSAAGRPILNIVRSAKDSSTAFFEGYPAVRNVVEGEESLKGEMAAELVRFLEDPPPVERVALGRWLSPFRVEAIADVYERLLCGERACHP